MKRDLDLVRKLLLDLEEKSDNEFANDIEVDGYSEEEVRYHLVLMYEAGLLRGEIRTRGPISVSKVVEHVYPVGLTWDGHEFLEAARNDTFWQRAKEMVKSKSGALSMELVKEVLIAMARKSVDV